ncbi:MAG: bifunctional glutamate N-acetyltransferase/amino-acid acetyltransferase ArgJ [Deltaproteobacteria bacterium]|nr:bifunctional glutamate N-acetyltransferase/amino-acid acetyltransferase ArgJ [Deltaproteobacteria bacterium]
MRTPKGWTYAGVHAGIKAVRRDLALFASEAPCVAAALLTQNKAKAAPIVDLAPRLPGEGFRALVINSGNANALTGEAGVADVRALNAGFAGALGVQADQVISTSTGVIGVRLPAAKLIAAAPRAIEALRSGIEAAAEAILTTDTRPKLAHRVVRVGGRDVTIAACAKGSGMIAPQPATMLAVLPTDAPILLHDLQAILARATAGTFGDLVIDGETSTNDAVFALANGLAGGAPLEGRELHAFADATHELCEELARSIAEDGEGATKSIEVLVDAAADGESARELAHAVAGSILVKTAVFGADPNWGRVLAAMGARAAARDLAFDPARATVRIQGVTVFAKGEPIAFDPPSLKARMREPRVRIDVDLGLGAHQGRGLGCDLSYDYVKINADYTSLITASAEGVVTKDDRLTNYTPGFKRALLVEALSYIAKFAGKRAVVCVRGDALVKDSLKATFAADINLLDAAGLLPIVVHGGGEEITRTLEKLGASRREIVRSEGGPLGHEVGEADPKMVEMVLTGRVSNELVSLLNQEQARAVGISGKDGGLLRAKRSEGRHGEIVSVDVTLLELLLGKEYVPVISPIGLGDDGEGYSLDTHAAAAEIAVALKADKLILIADAPGILQEGELISEMTAAQLSEKIAQGIVVGGMLELAHSALRAIAGGVARVHVVDGRVPHGVIAELFTDRGVGTLITP